MDNSIAEARKQPVNATASRTLGVNFRTLDAALVGAVNTAVARWAAAPVITRRMAQEWVPGSANTAIPWIFANDANAGGSFQASEVARGLWRVSVRTALLSAAGATRVMAALVVDALAADLLVATTPTQKDGDRVLDVADMQFIAGAGNQQSALLEGVIAIPQSARPMVRLLLSNGVGGAVVAGTVSLAATSIDFTWLRDVA